MKEFIKKHETAFIIILAIIIILLCVSIFFSMRSDNVDEYAVKYKSVLDNDVVMSVTLGEENTSPNNEESNVKIAKEEAAKIAKEESKKERYQINEETIEYTASSSDGQVNADLTNKTSPYRWNDELEYTDENGQGLYTNQQMWCVRLSDKNNKASNIYIYIDAQNGNVVGAGMSN